MSAAAGPGVAKSVTLVAVTVANRGGQLDGVGLGAPQLEVVGVDEDLHALTASAMGGVRG